MSALETLRTFDENSLPDLDTVVLGALEFLSQTELPELDYGQFQRPLVIGSVNAAAVGRLLFVGTPAVFADESTYDTALANHQDVDGVVVVTASGAKHAVGVVEEVQAAGLPLLLVTNTADSPAADLLQKEQVVVFPKVREPYTYNVSTYLSMLLARGGEDPAGILTFINEQVTPAVPDTLDTYDAFTLLVQPEFEDMRPMLRTKFDELFGPEVQGEAFTFEEAKHAKTVVPSDKECFISFGEANTLFGKSEQRVHVPLPDNAGPAAMMAIGYYVIGRIQAEHPPYFKENIVRYTKEASEIFGQSITPIVE